jgi:uncharacterized protein YcnI
MKNKLLQTLFLTLALILTATQNTFAHVVVKPPQAPIAAFQTFTIGVPVERNVPTTSLRLLIPEGLNYVTPNVKTGWTIEVKKEGADEYAKVKEIIWSAGTIPPGQRDEFIFSAQVPSTPTTLQWKAYQTYQDNKVVAWDADPKAQSVDKEDESKSGPYSETKIIDDLGVPEKISPTDTTTQITRIVSYAALIISLLSLALTLKKHYK